MTNGSVAISEGCPFRQTSHERAQAAHRGVEFRVRVRVPGPRLTPVSRWPR